MATAAAGGSWAHDTKQSRPEPPATRGPKRPPAGRIPVSFWCHPGGAGNTRPSPMETEKAITEIVVLSYCLFVLLICNALWCRGHHPLVSWAPPPGVVGTTPDAQDTTHPALCA